MSRFQTTRIVLLLIGLALASALGACRSDFRGVTADDFQPIFGDGRMPTAREHAMASAAAEVLRIRGEIACCNLANIDTPGYKARRAVQQPTLNTIGEPAGPAIAATTLDMFEGSPHKGAALDVQILGNGFLRVETKGRGIAYTRDGRLTLDADGRLITAVGGLPLLPQITVPPNAMRIDIDESGQVFTMTPGSLEPQLVGQLELAGFVSPESLRPGPGSLFLETAGCGAPRVGTPGQDGLGRLLQGMYECSNVDPRAERIELLMIERERSLWELPLNRSQAAARR